MLHFFFALPQALDRCRIHPLTTRHGRATLSAPKCGPIYARLGHKLGVLALHVCNVEVGC